MKCIEELGLLKYIGDEISSLIKSCNELDRLVIALLILTILSAIISSLIDNIPYFLFLDLFIFSKTFLLKIDF